MTTVCAVEHVPFTVHQQPFPRRFAPQNITHVYLLRDAVAHISRAALFKSQGLRARPYFPRYKKQLQNVIVH
jgi:hypothetical protein